MIPIISGLVSFSFKNKNPNNTEKTTWNFIKNEVTGGPAVLRATTQNATETIVITEDIIVTVL